MLYASIDMESTGLDPERCDVLSLSVIIENTNNKLSFNDIPKFNAAILHPEITGSPRAISMNSQLIKYIGEYLECYDKRKREIENISGFSFYQNDDVVKAFYRFLFDNGFGYDITNWTNKINFDGKFYPAFSAQTKSIVLTAAGKNFNGLDRDMLSKLPWWQKLIRVRQRFLDPSILLLDWKNDDFIPDLDLCKKRLEIPGPVMHTSESDAWDIIQILRKFY